MSVLQALVLGAVQGLTEFIPISSSGHLVVVPGLFNWDSPGLAFDVLLHAASLIALLVYFFGDLIDLARGLLARGRNERRLLLLLVVGTLPAVVAGLAFSDFFEGRFEEEKAAALQLLITAAILVAAEQALARHVRRTAATGHRLRGVSDLRPLDAVGIGLAQAVAILPGISRSGSTIGAGLGLGMDRPAAARFAFLLAIPALLGASLLQIPDLGGSSLGPGAAAAGFATSLVSSYAAIWGLLRFLRSRSLYPFAAYCMVAGVVFYLVL